MTCLFRKLRYSDAQKNDPDTDLTPFTSNLIWITDLNSKGKIGKNIYINVGLVMYL